MANQISQLADAVNRLDTQLGKLPSQPTPNVWNVSAISVSCGMDPLPEELVSELVEIASSPRKCEIRFDPPLNFSIYVPRAPFPNRLIVAQRGSRKEELRSALSLEIQKPVVESKKVWTEVHREEKKEENKQADVIRQEVILLGDLPVK